MLFTLTLPNSRLRINIPAMRERTTVTEIEDGQGVVPDREVQSGISDFLSKRDPILEAARQPR